MKNLTLAGMLLCMAALAHAADDGSKTVRVDEKAFSDVYPAVWFSPSTGEITPLKEKSEVPPEEKYEIWIEPDDPEFGYNPDAKPKGVGFARIGSGADAFRDPSIPDSPQLKLSITHLMQETQAQEPLVFYCKAKTSTCLIMVTAMNKAERVIQFKWRLLTREEDASNSTPEATR